LFAYIFTVQQSTVECHESVPIKLLQSVAARVMSPFRSERVTETCISLPAKLISWL